MKITRNGIEYELTWQEIRDAYLLMEREYLKEDIKSKADDINMDLSEKDLDKLAIMVNKTLRNNDSYWDSYWMSIEYVLKETEEV
jgi:hypothetical protein